MSEYKFGVTVPLTANNLSCVMCHMSHVTCHVSRVTCHMSSVFLFFLFFLQSGGAIWWRVCYQQGLTRLVSFIFLTEI